MVGMSLDRKEKKQINPNWPVVLHANQYRRTLWDRGTLHFRSTFPPYGNIDTPRVSARNPKLLELSGGKGKKNTTLGTNTVLGGKTQKKGSRSQDECTEKKITGRKRTPKKNYAKQGGGRHQGGGKGRKRRYGCGTIFTKVRWWVGPRKGRKKKSTPRD